MSHVDITMLRSGLFYLLLFQFDLHRLPAAFDGSLSFKVFDLEIIKKNLHEHPGTTKFVYIEFCERVVCVCVRVRSRVCAAG